MTAIDAHQLLASRLEAQLQAVLKTLYRDELRARPNEYLRYHSSDQAINSRVNSFLGYQEHIPRGGRVLDWGCQHAPDACMVRAATAVDGGLSLHGCDFLPQASYPVFWDFCGFEFKTLTHHVTLPFQDNMFDCVIGGGVLEHTAMDYESLKELHRIIAPDGILVLTHLPNKFSYVEFAARVFRRRDFHHRLYTVAGITSMLKHAGFLPVKVHRHRFLPTNSLRWITRILSPHERLIDRIWPLSLFCGDILVVARKVRGF